MEQLPHSMDFLDGIGKRPTLGGATTTAGIVTRDGAPLAPLIPTADDSATSPFCGILFNATVPLLVTSTLPSVSIDMF